MLKGKENKEHFIGTWNISSPGYVRIDMKGIKKTGALFANVIEMHITGSAIDANTAYVKNNDDNYFYWGRRGPSVHINYDTTETGDDAEWFYNEITVPAGNDVQTASLFFQSFCLTRVILTEIPCTYYILLQGSGFATAKKQLDCHSFEL